MGPKKQMKSPFGLYMTKMKRDNKDLRSLPMNQLVSDCNNLYKNLSEEELQKWKQLSDFVRNNTLNDHQINEELDKFSLKEEDNWDQQSGASSGNQSFPELTQMSQKLCLTDEEVDTLTIVEKALETVDHFPKKTIIIICFNISVHTLEDEYYPNEISLIQFTLEDGVQQEFNKLIANEVPDGYYAKAKEFSDKYHKIPLNCKDIKAFETDIPVLYKQIYDFMSDSDLKDMNNHKLVFCKAPQRPGLSDRFQVIGSLQWFDKQMKLIDENMSKSLVEDFEILELSDLLFICTKNYCQKTRPKSLCIEDLNGSLFDYCPQMRCIFHLSDDHIYCSLTAVKRSVYLFFDLIFRMGLRQEFDIKPKPSHRPPKEEGNPLLVPIKSILTEKGQTDERPQSDSTLKDESIKDLDCSVGRGLGRGRKLQNLLKQLNKN